MTSLLIMLLTFSALWHCFSMPNPLGILRWGVTVRPQVNVKPRMHLMKDTINQCWYLTNADDTALFRSTSITRDSLRTDGIMRNSKPINQHNLLIIAIQ
uniref:Secreted protein n=1 Tax=Parascaris equorum TaxID=6256 RepID=A0A914RMK9_PAREQ